MNDLRIDFTIKICCAQYKVLFWRENSEIPKMKDLGLIYLIKIHSDKSWRQRFSQNKLLTALKVFLLPLGGFCK